MTARRLHWSVIGLYTVLTLILTWPLAARITTHVPGIAQWAFDESTFIWNIWYFKDAVVDRQASPLHTELTWYPLGIDLVLYTYNFFHALLALPPALAVNLAFGSNVALLISTILSGYGTFLLVLYLLRQQDAAWATTGTRPQLLSVQARHWAPAFVAGLLYAFASNRAIYAALGHYDMVTTQWIPFYALMLLRSLDSSLRVAQRQKAAALAGLFFAFTGLAEMISALFLAIFTVIVVLVWLAGPERLGLVQADDASKDRARGIAARLASLFAMLGIIGGVAFLLWAPVLIPILRQFLTDDFSLKGWGEAIPLSTDLLGWFTPTILHPLWGGDLVADLRRVQLKALSDTVPGFRDVNTVFLGWASAALALIGLLRYRRQVTVWAWTVVVFGLFTLGPFLQINGRYRFDLDGVEATFPMPYALLHYIPVIKANRAPNRNSVLLMLGLAVLVGYALYWLWQKWESRARTTQRPAWGQGRYGRTLVTGVLAGAILIEHLTIPLPLSDASVPALYTEIAADPRPVSVLQLPLGWRNSFGVFGPEKTLLQYYQSAHGKPMLGGNISRAPDFKMDYFRRIPYFMALTEVEFGRPVADELMAAARAQAQELAYLYNIGYVVLYPPIPERYPYVDTWQASWDFVKATLPLEPEPFWAQDGIEAYRLVELPGSDRFAIDLGQPGTLPYRGEGWDDAEVDTPYEADATWATARQSRLFMPLRGVDDTVAYELAARIHPFAYADGPAQRIAIMVNGVLLGEQPLANSWQEVTWTIPGHLLADGLNHVQLDWGYAAAPRTVIPGGRPIGATSVEAPIDMDLKGFADGGFIALFDEAGDQLDASAGRRGVNVTVLSPASGAVQMQVGFDTTANEFESAALAAALRQIEDGAVVLVVSHGEATDFLTDEAVAALQGIGADVTLDSLRDQHFVIAGVQGAGPGTAAMVIDPVDAFLRISLNPDRRTLAAAVDWVRLQPTEE